MNYYQILEISENATVEEIKQKYKNLIKTYHPDLYDGDKNFANEKTKEITQAYKILVNPHSRYDYDLLLHSEFIDSKYDDYNYDYHNNFNDSYDSQYSDENIFNNSSSKKYKTPITDFIDKKYDDFTTKSVDYILNSNNNIKLLFSILLVLIVIAFFLTQVSELQVMKTNSIKKELDYNSKLKTELRNTTKLDQSILNSITITDLQEEFGEDILNQIKDGTFENIDDLKTFYYYNSKDDLKINTK